MTKIVSADQIKMYLDTIIFARSNFGFTEVQLQKLIHTCKIPRPTIDQSDRLSNFELTTHHRRRRCRYRLQKLVETHVGTSTSLTEFTKIRQYSREQPIHRQ